MKIKNLIYLAILTLGVLSSSSSYAIPSPNPINEPVYICHRASGKINIDGKINEHVWRKAQIIDKFFVPQTLKPAASKTEARLLWDDRYLYVSFNVEDKDIKSTLTKRDSDTCNEDCLEIFIMPYAGSTTYCNFEINALGTVKDALHTSMSSPGGNKWDCHGLKVAVSIDGTINDSSDIDKSWQMEAAIPLSELPFPGGKSPRPGDICKFHLARYDYSKYIDGGVELTSCAMLTKVNFHNYPEWCTLKFEK